MARHARGQRRRRRRADARRCCPPCAARAATSSSSTPARDQRLAGAGVLLGEQVRAAGVRRLAARRRARPARHLGASRAGSTPTCNATWSPTRSATTFPSSSCRRRPWPRWSRRRWPRPPDAHVHEVVDPATVGTAPVMTGVRGARGVHRRPARRAWTTGRVTAVELLEAYLARIAAYDGELNAVVVRNPDARADAEASDARRAAGETMRPAGRHPLHRQGQLPGPRADGRGGQPGVRRAGRPARLVRHRASARGGRRADRLSPTCRRWPTAECSAASTAAPKAPTTPTISPRRSPPARRTAPAPRPRRRSARSASARRPGPPVAVLRRTTRCAPTRRRAG